MNITITENLKQLRKGAGKTQDNLAEFLDISISAVSKWERGECYPDIELLPKIAAFYDVTVDDLLGVGEMRKREKIAEIHKVGNELLQKKEYEQALKHYSDARNEFPHDKGIALGFAQALGFGNYEDTYAAAMECDEILASLENGKMYCTATALSCFLHAKLGFGMFGDERNMDKAMKIAKNLPHVQEGREVTMAILHSAITAENADDFLRVVAIGDYSQWKTLHGFSKTTLDFPTDLTCPPNSPHS